MQAITNLDFRIAGVSKPADKVTVQRLIITMAPNSTSSKLARIEEDGQDQFDLGNKVVKDFLDAELESLNALVRKRMMDALPRDLL